MFFFVVWCGKGKGSGRLAGGNSDFLGGREKKHSTHSAPRAAFKVSRTRSLATPRPTPNLPRTQVARSPTRPALLSPTRRAEIMPRRGAWNRTPDTTSRSIASRKAVRPAQHHKFRRCNPLVAASSLASRTQSALDADRASAKRIGRWRNGRRSREARHTTHGQSFRSPSATPIQEKFIMAI